MAGPRRDSASPKPTPANLASVPLACLVALGVHFAVQKRDPEPDTTCYVILLGAVFLGSITLSGLQAVNLAVRRWKQPLTAEFGSEAVVKTARAIEIAGAETDVTDLSHGVSSPFYEPRCRKVGARASGAHAGRSPALQPANAGAYPEDRLSYCFFWRSVQNTAILLPSRSRK